MNSPSNRELEIFNSALERAASVERNAYLDGACGDDAAMRTRIEALLKAHAAAGGFLPAEDPKPPAASAKTLVMTTGMFPVTEKAGDRIGHYKLREKIGEGGCGVVYVADQEAPVRRRVALKVIKLGMDTKSVIARFEAERQALAMMDHPNIAKVLDAGATEAGRPYFVMELVRGIKIIDYCDQNKLTTRERLDLFIKVCQAIQHAHQKGIIHRDIKPSNILVTLHDGVPVPKIIDFGISKATEGRLTELTVYTELHQFIGTPAYMSPEQAEMSGLDIDTRTDIYSLGVLLYELLTGGTPFNAQELVQSGLDAMRKTIREIEPVRPSTRLSTMMDADLTAVAQRHGAESPKLVHLIRGDLDWIVMKSLEKDRTRRYETANGLAMDIQRHLTNEPIIARPPSTFYRFQKMVRRNKLAFAATGAVAAVVVLGLVFSSWEAILATKAQRDERSARVVAEESQTKEVEQRKLADENARKAIASEQNARSLLYVADMRLVHQAWEDGNLSRMTSLLEEHRPKPGEIDERGFEYFYFENLAKGEQEEVLYHATNAVLGVAISPDGKWLASRTTTEVRLWDLASKSLVSAFADAATNEESSMEQFEFGVSFSHDSRYLGIATDTGLQLFDTSTRETRNLSTEAVGWAAFSPVTNLIAFDSINNSTHEIGARIWDYVDKKEVSKLKTGRGLSWSSDGTRLLSGRGNGVLKSWDTTWVQVQTNYFDMAISAAVISPIEGLMAAADWNGKVHLIEPGGTREIGILPSGQVRDPVLAFSPDGKFLATGSDSEVIQIWDVGTRQRIRQLRGHKGKITSLAFTPDGRTLASTASDGDILLWNPARQTSDLQIPNRLLSWRPILPVFSPNSKWLGLPADDKISWLIDLPQLKASAAVEGRIMAFSPDDKQFVTAIGVDDYNVNELQVSDIGSASKRASIHLDTVPGQFAPQLTPDGAFCALLKRVDGRLNVQLFKTATGEEIITSFGFQPGSTWCYPLIDGRQLVYTDRDRYIHILDLQSRTNTLSIKCFFDVDCLAVSPDEKTLAASHSNGTISLWDMRSGAQQGILAGHQAAVLSLAFSPDGRTLASGSEDRTLKLWNLAAQRELASFAQDQGAYGLTFSPDGQMLVFGNFNSYCILRAPRVRTAIPSTVNMLSMAELPTNSIWRVPDGADRTPSRMVTEQAQCFTNMLKISAAIMAYRKDHQQMPNWLSDLVPKYLSDTNCLICPTCARTGEKPNNYGMDDPNIESSYLYEFNTHPALNDPFGLASPGDTMKMWKEKQLARYGPVVPVVRCHIHPNDLTVTVAGEPRVDGKEMWEIKEEIPLQLKESTVTHAEWLNNIAWGLVGAVSPSRQRPAPAVKSAERAVELEPKNGAYWNTLGVACYRNGEFKKAVAALEKSVELGHNAPDTYDPVGDALFLAMAHHQLGDDDSARRYYSQASRWVRVRAKPDLEDYFFQVEAEHLLGPAFAGETESETAMPANSK